MLTSNAGNVTQQAGAVIDISAAYNNAGTLTVQALGAGAGNVNLAGDIDGASTGQYLAGGGATSDVPLVFMPYAMGGIDISAQTIGDFAGLNQRLTTTGVTGSRSFDIKQGDLVVGNEVKANSVTISVDGGSLTVNGTIDASGAEVGTIRLSARDDLVLTASGKLDAHGTVLQVDSYGDPIESANRAVIELTTTQGDSMAWRWLRQRDLRHRCQSDRSQECRCQRCPRRLRRNQSQCAARHQRHRAGRPEQRPVVAHRHDLRRYQDQRGGSDEHNRRDQCPRSMASGPIPMRRSPQGRM